MAKCRFPGKALKLNNRKRVKYRWDTEENVDKFRIHQFKTGLNLFRNVFGNSDEDSDEEFCGFEPLTNNLDNAFRSNENKLNNTLQNQNKPVGNVFKEELLYCSGSEEETAECNRIDDTPQLRGNTPINDESVIIKCLDKELYEDKSAVNESLEAHVPKKKPKDAEELVKQFPLRQVSTRSSRVIKSNSRPPNRDETNCSTKKRGNEIRFETVQGAVVQEQPSAKVIEKDDSATEEDDSVCRSIALYTEAITEQFKGHVGRPSKKLLRKCEGRTDSIEDQGSPHKGIKEDKVKEKIEKLLRSPWDKRLKLNLNTGNPLIKIKEKDGEASLPSSKSILRKAKLNINNKTLEKIRSPSSIQLLVPLTKEDVGGTAAKKCGLCLCVSKQTFLKFGVACCEPCHFSICCFTEESFPNLACPGGQGECQLVGLSLNERCQACWLGRILSTCAMPSLLHDRLRKHLPPLIISKLPKSFGRVASNYNSSGDSQEEEKHSVDFSSVVDFPGGWRRIVGSSNIIVKSPSGERFHSVSKLKRFLRRQGLNADANALFGESHSKRDKHSDRRHKVDKDSAKCSSSKGNNNVVVTTLPGGWTRTIKWRHSGDKFDTYVCSPDGKTFYGEEQLQAYFHSIGKVDGIKKYFPVKNLPLCVNSGDSSETSIMDTCSSTESDAKSSRLSEKHLRDTSVIASNLSDTSDKKVDSSNNTIIISNFLSDEGKSLSQNLGEESSPGDVSAIDLNMLSDDKSESERIDFKISSCSPENVLKTSSKLKKRKKKKKKRHHRTQSAKIEPVSDFINNKAMLIPNQESTTPLISTSESAATMLVPSQELATSQSPIEESASSVVSNQDVLNTEILKKESASSFNKSRTKDTRKKNPVTKSRNVKKPKDLLPKFSKVSFGNDWVRRIKWKPDGTGEITYIISPDGQRIVSSIELMAYLKKAGKQMFSIDHYFPKNLVRSTQVDEQDNGKGHPSDVNDQLSQVDEKNQLTDNFTETGRKILFSIPKEVCVLKVPSKTTSNSNEENLVVDVETLAETSDEIVGDGGPRVKHVCRSQAQVLGMPRALFPTPEKEDDSKNKILIKKIKGAKGKRPKFPAIAQTERLAKKIIWCHECVGCKTPNCRKCINCIDMKKYGGKGSKKKPCVMRRCFNPKKSTKVLLSNPQKVKTKKIANSNSGNEKKTAGRGSDTDVMSIKLSSVSADSDEFCVDNDELPSNVSDRSIFIPTKIRNITESKDRTDILAGKKCVPGSAVNIDFWQEYDAEEMLMSGFPIITSMPAEIDSLCFRCGSTGREELIFCIWCCEGVHPFCLEEGEGPECEDEEYFWICKRCSVCHICGEPANNLRQCNDCRKHFHIECLGPTSHISCHTSSEGAWYCVRCVKCEGCGKPNIVDWVDVAQEKILLSPGSDVQAKLTPFCLRCLELRHSNNFCPICFGCYEDDDFESKMMECAKCKEWVHSHCEGLSDECYQILSLLPDTVEYVCQLCLVKSPASWMQSVKKEMEDGLQSVLNGLLNNKYAKNLVRLEQKSARSTYDLENILYKPSSNTDSIIVSDSKYSEQLIFKNASSSIIVPEIDSSKSVSELNLANLMEVHDELEAIVTTLIDTPDNSFVLQGSNKLQSTALVGRKKAFSNYSSGSTEVSASLLESNKILTCTSHSYEVSAPIQNCSTDSTLPETIAISSSSQESNNISNFLSKLPEICNSLQEVVPFLSKHSDSYNVSDSLISSTEISISLPASDEIESSLRGESTKISASPQENLNTVFMQEATETSTCTFKSTEENQINTRENLEPGREVHADIAADLDFDANFPLIEKYQIELPLLDKDLDSNILPAETKLIDSLITQKEISLDCSQTEFDLNSSRTGEICSNKLSGLRETRTQSEGNLMDLVTKDSISKRRISKKRNILKSTDNSGESKLILDEVLPRRLTRSRSLVVFKSEIEKFKLRPCTVLIKNLKINKTGDNQYLQHVKDIEILKSSDCVTDISEIDQNFYVKDIENNVSSLLNADCCEEEVTVASLSKPIVEMEIKDICNTVDENKELNPAIDLMRRIVNIKEISDTDQCDTSSTLQNVDDIDTTQSNDPINHQATSSVIVSDSNTKISDKMSIMDQEIESDQQTDKTEHPEASCENYNLCSNSSNCQNLSLIQDNINEVEEKSKPLFELGVISFMSEADTDLAPIENSISLEPNDMNVLAQITSSSTSILGGCTKDMISYPELPKVCKEIDDDCLSSETSSFCGSDTEIESIFDDSEEPRTLQDIKLKIIEGQYSSVLQFHVDVMGIINGGKNVNKVQFKSCKFSYLKFIKERFPWFDSRKIDIFNLIDNSHPFPYPSIDHNYADLALKERTSSRILSKRKEFPMKTSPKSSPKLVQDQTNDPRKCILCNVSGDGNPTECGRLLYLGQDEWLHVNCCLWSSEVYEEQDGGLQNVYVAVSRGRQIKCSLCNERGATVGCCHRSCQATYHFMCARENGSFLGLDKQIYCRTHAAAATNVKPIEDLRVGRCVFVKLDSEKRKWKRTLSTKVQVMIGSLVINNLGKMNPDLDCDDVLLPLDYSTTRMYWSTKDPLKRVRYTCRTKKIIPYQLTGESDAQQGTEFHLTVNHSEPPEIVKIQLKIIKDWHKEVERQIWAKQSRQTNIIPPHLCPLYRQIVSMEKKQKLENDQLNLSQVRRKLFSISSDSNNEEDDVRQCLESILERISDSPGKESNQEDVQSDSDFIKNIVSDDGSMMVNADDNEIISMVLRDLPVIENSAPHSPPSGRLSPLDDLNFLDSYNDIGRETIAAQRTDDEHIIDNETFQNNEADPQSSDTQLMYQKIVEACDPHVQDQILAHVNQSCNIESMNDPTFFQSNLPFFPGPLSITDYKFPNEAFHPPLSFGPFFTNESELNNFIRLNLHNYPIQQVSEPCEIVPATNACNSMGNCDSELCELNKFLTCSAANEQIDHMKPNIQGNEKLENQGNETVTGEHESFGSPEIFSRDEAHSPAFTQTSSSNSKKQICRVLPMPASVKCYNLPSARNQSEAIDSLENISVPSSQFLQDSPADLNTEGQVHKIINDRPKRKLKTKRNYKSGRKNTRIKTVQIEINETIEISSDEEDDCHRPNLKRKWNEDVSCSTSDSKRTKDETDLGSTVKVEKEVTLDHLEDSNKRSHQVVKFSDNHNDITVSIVNNNPRCSFSKPKRCHRLRRKTILQLDGACDISSSSEDNSSKPPMQSNLALHIKQQSLARSSPGEEGPFKCSKCKRLYRTKDSFNRHVEICTFEIDSSSTTDSEESLDGTNVPTGMSKLETLAENENTEKKCEDVTHSSLTDSQTTTTNSLKKLQELCSPLLNDSPSKTPGIHRQIRTFVKRSETGDISNISSGSTVTSSISSFNEVFVPPIKSPLKTSPAMNKGGAAKRYTNIRLYKGKNKGYQYRRALPQVSIKPQPSIVQINHMQQQANMPLTFLNQNTFSNNAFSTQTPINNQVTEVPVNRMVTVVSGNSVAVPQGYTLQYVGSYRENEMTPSNLITYQPQHMVVNPIMMAAPQIPVVVPQVPTPMVVPQMPVVNTNVTYTIPNAEGMVFNQPTTVVPNVQYIPQAMPQPLIQQQQATLMSFAAPTAIPHSVAPSFTPLPSPEPLQQLPQLQTVITPVVPPPPTPRERPQAFISPLVRERKPENARPIFPLSNSVNRSVATVAPAIYTNSMATTRPQMVNSRDQNTFPKMNQILEEARPRPTYSYRDAMTVDGDGSLPPEKKLKCDSEIFQATDQMKSKTSDKDESQERQSQNTSSNTTHSYRLVLKKESQSGSKFKITSFPGPALPMSNHEVKEVRIKAKVSVGPKRKKYTERVQRYWGNYDKEYIVGSKDVTNEMGVNEQEANASPKAMNKLDAIDDSSLIDKPNNATPSPYIVFELTSEDGFKVESRHVNDVWQKVFDVVSEARVNMKPKGCKANINDAPAAKGKTMSGLEMLGLNHNAVQYLLEQLPGSKDCHKYSFQFHKRPTEDDEIFETASGCARTESFKMRSPYDIFSWLASKHRKIPEPISRISQEETQLSTRRATSLELPMAMRYRHICETAREAVGVFRSSIHGRGLFCKRDIDSAEMVIEYAGQVIRSCLCDMREKFYESKGIGCYMFRIDEEIVVDATMHGNAARFINHSCEPNCYSRVVDILGMKHIIIFALRRIIRGEELTYDYKFPIEDDKISCTCGARKCRKYLN